jgi:bifunctional enzyme CysN/CysC
MATALSSVSAAAAARAEVAAYLEASARKTLLRFITCGSVDDGKSTLIGRLLHDSKMLFEDQLAALRRDSRNAGGSEGVIDYSLLVDGLAAEREQGITIDVAYRFFATEKRKFIVADTPGHEQYTRNMATGASTADLAVILVDARHGMLTQTRRHAYLANLLGIRRLVLAVNKMDLVGYSQSRFDEIVADFRAFAQTAGLGQFAAIPVSGLQGDNVIVRSAAMPWYDGPALLEHLESVPAARRTDAAPFRMAVQWVNRPNAGFRGYAGRIASGSVRPGERIAVLPSGQQSRVKSIVTFDGDLDLAIEGQSVTLTFEDELDCSRGDLVSSAAVAPKLVSSLGATLVWMADQPLVPGRSYWLKIGTRTVSAQIGRIDHLLDVNSLERQPGRPLALNDIGWCEIELDRPVPGISYAEDRQLGGFILIDKLSNATIAAGLVESFTAARSGSTADAGDSRIMWIGGASGAERAALAAGVQQRLQAVGRIGFILDEALLRTGLSADLGTGGEDRAESIRRAREVAKLMALAGVHVLVAMDVAPEEAHPGRMVGPADLDEKGADQWVI